MSIRRAVVVLSGGQDSTTCLYYAKRAGYELHTVTFDYGQRHYKEIHAAASIADRARVASHQKISIIGTLRGTSPLVSDAELEQYKDHESLPGGLEKTFVPMRNQLFLTIAANIAYCLDTNLIFTGVCQEDFGGYPDCRREFIDQLQKTCNLGAFNEDACRLPLQIETPLMYLTKAQTVKLALRLPECYAALAYTVTSYDGAYPPTGKDHATLLRAKGFIEAGVPDPLILRAHLEGLMDLPDTENYKGDDVNSYMKTIHDTLPETSGEYDMP